MRRAGQRRLSPQRGRTARHTSAAAPPQPPATPLYEPRHESAGHYGAAAPHAPAFAVGSSQQVGIPSLTLEHQARLAGATVPGGAKPTGRRGNRSPVATSRGDRGHQHEHSRRITPGDGAAEAAAAAAAWRGKSTTRRDPRRSSGARRSAPRSPVSRGPARVPAPAVHDPSSHKPGRSRSHNRSGASSAFEDATRVKLLENEQHMHLHQIGQLSRSVSMLAKENQRLRHNLAMLHKAVEAHGQQHRHDHDAHAQSPTANGSRDTFKITLSLSDTMNGTPARPPATTRIAKPATTRASPEAAPTNGAQPKGASGDAHAPPSGTGTRPKFSTEDLEELRAALLESERKRNAMHRQRQRDRRKISELTANLEVVEKECVRVTNVSKNRVSQLDRRLQVLEMEREHDLTAWQLEREQLVQVLKHRGQVVEVPSAVDMMGMSMGMGLDGTGETAGMLPSPGGLGDGGVTGHVGGPIEDSEGDGDDGDGASGDGDGGKDGADGDDGARSIASGPAGLHIGGVHGTGPASVAMSMRDDGVGTGALSSALSVDGTEAGGLPPLGLTGRRRRYGAAEARRRRWQTVARSTQTRRVEKLSRKTQTTRRWITRDANVQTDLSFEPFVLIAEREFAEPPYRPYERRYGDDAHLAMPPITGAGPAVVLQPGARSRSPMNDRGAGGGLPPVSPARSPLSYGERNFGGPGSSDGERSEGGFRNDGGSMDRLSGDDDMGSRDSVEAAPRASGIDPFVVPATSGGRPSTSTAQPSPRRPAVAPSPRRVSVGTSGGDSGIANGSTRRSPAGPSGFDTDGGGSGPSKALLDSVERMANTSGSTGPPGSGAGGRSSPALSGGGGGASTSEGRAGASGDVSISSTDRSISGISAPSGSPPNIRDSLRTGTPDPAGGPPDVVAAFANAAGYGTHVNIFADVESPKHGAPDAPAPAPEGVAAGAASSSGANGHGFDTGSSNRQGGAPGAGAAPQPPREDPATNPGLAVEARGWLDSEGGPDSSRPDGAGDVARTEVDRVVDTQARGSAPKHDSSGSLVDGVGTYNPDDDTDLDMGLGMSSTSPLHRRGRAPADDRRPHPLTVQTAAPAAAGTMASRRIPGVKPGSTLGRVVEDGESELGYRLVTRELLCSLLVKRSGRFVKSWKAEQFTVVVRSGVTRQAGILIETVQEVFLREYKVYKPSRSKQKPPKLKAETPVRGVIVNVAPDASRQAAFQISTTDGDELYLLAPASPDGAEAVTDAWLRAINERVPRLYGNRFYHSDDDAEDEDGYPDPPPVEPKVQRASQASMVSSNRNGRGGGERGTSGAALHHGVGSRQSHNTYATRQSHGTNRSSGTRGHAAGRARTTKVAEMLSEEDSDDGYGGLWD